MDIIKLSHGSGGAETAALIREVFMKYFHNDINLSMNDSAVLDVSGRIAFTSDSYVVKPVFFQGGDIGRLAVCGTVNDLLTSGAEPLYISACFIIEEGFLISDLHKICRSMAEATDEAGVKIVTGDTKVIESSEHGGLYINTSGIGKIHGKEVSFSDAGPGDAIIVTGNLGDHHACILGSRLNMQSSIKSDAAPLVNIISALIKSQIPLHGIRDITRGGLATVLNELAESCKMCAEIDESDIPVSKEVKGFCGILGLDPLYMGNEGKMVIVLPETDAGRALSIIRRQKYGESAAVIGRLTEGSGSVLRTRLGARRILPPLRGEGLPRIC